MLNRTCHIYLATQPMFASVRMLRMLVLACVVAFIMGCSAALVPYTSDPKQKIEYAYWLFGEKYRAIPAEKLLHESMIIYQKNGDTKGLAEANKAYAIFLRSYAVEKYRDRFLEKGFLKKDVTFENRFTKSIEYLKKAEDYYMRVGEYDALTNVYLHMGFTYMASNNQINGCSLFRKSIEANKVFIKNHPNAKVVSDGYGSYDDYMDNIMKKAECKTISK